MGADTSENDLDGKGDVSEPTTSRQQPARFLVADEVTMTTESNCGTEVAEMADPEADSTRNALAGATQSEIQARMHVQNELGGHDQQRPPDQDPFENNARGALQAESTVEKEQSQVST